MSGARLLDLTRLVSRHGRGAWTGVDRVEAAYLDHFLDHPDPMFVLVRLATGFALLDRDGARALRDRLTGAVPMARTDLAGQLSRKLTPAQRIAQAEVRRLALAQTRPRWLDRLLRQHLPEGFTWIATGLTNLTDASFDGVHRAGGGTVVLVHDTIPLDHPEWQRPEMARAFEERMRLTAQKADRVIANSAATAADITRHFARFGRTPPITVAPLGVTVPVPTRLPAGIDPARPAFVALGTLEPRKNIGLLLDVWDDFAATLPEAEIPALHLVGARGWQSEALFARIDTSPLTGRHVFEHTGLDDGAVAALLAHARALVMPSLAEGFGLPPAEALALGTPVILTDLPVYREILGNNPVYAAATDMYPWREAILGFARGDRTQENAAVESMLALPTWQGHFNLVLKVT